MNGQRTAHLVSEFFTKSVGVFVMPGIASFKRRRTAEGQRENLLLFDLRFVLPVGRFGRYASVSFSFVFWLFYGLLARHCFDMFVVCVDIRYFAASSTRYCLCVRNFFFLLFLCLFRLGFHQHRMFMDLIHFNGINHHIWLSIISLLVPFAEAIHERTTANDTQRGITIVIMAATTVNGCSHSRQFIWDVDSLAVYYLPAAPSPSPERFFFIQFACLLLSDGHSSTDISPIQAPWTMGAEEQRRNDKNRNVESRKLRKFG